MSSQNFEERNDDWANELQSYAPLTVEHAPEGFVDRVMARIGEVDNFTVVTGPQVSPPHRTGGRFRRIFPIAATAAAFMLLFAMPALRRGSLAGFTSPQAAAPSTLEAAEDSKMKVRAGADGAGTGDTAGVDAETDTSNDAASVLGVAPEEGALPQENPVEGEAADNGLPTPFTSSLSRGGGGLIDEDEAEGYCLLYGATARPAGISFCIILEGGTPPEDVLPVVPGQYLITPEQLETLLEEQPEGVEPEYVEDGLTPSATLGLVIIKQPPSDN